MEHKFKARTWLFSALLTGHLALLGLVGAAPSSMAQSVAGLPNFVEIYEQQGPTVVSITVAKNMRSSGSARRFGFPDMDPDDLPEPFRRFFQLPPGPRGGQQPERDRGPIRSGAGSGFIISSDGYIVTNHHVVDGADEVTVTLTDKREFKAKIVGSDPRTDTALLKIEATGLKAVKIGDPNALKVGEWVVAIGQPLGLENSLTKGVVSAKGRNVGDRDTLASFIQHDAAVNRGNSGGPLFNMRGEVVGVNTMIYTNSGGFMGLSFAVPIDQAMDVVRQLQTTGRIQRGRLGVAIAPVNKDIAEAFGLPRPYGALVNSVEKDTAAEKAGIKERDIIIKFDGKVVNESAELPRMVTAVKPGVRVPVEVWREGKSMTINVVLGESKSEATVADANRSRSGAGADRGKTRLTRMDIEVSELSPEERRIAGVKNGVQIDSIRGRVRNLENGDIVLAVVYKGTTSEITNRESLEKALSKVEKGAAVSFQVRRQIRGEWITMVVTERLGDES